MILFCDPLNWSSGLRYTQVSSTNSILIHLRLYEIVLPVHGVSKMYLPAEIFCSQTLMKKFKNAKKKRRNILFTMGETTEGNGCLKKGRAIAQAVSRWLPTAEARVQGLVKWDLWWTKWRCDRFSPSTSGSPTNLHSIKFSIITITRGRYNRPFSSRRAEWTQFGLHPPLCKSKNNGCLRLTVLFTLRNPSVFIVHNKIYMTVLSCEICWVNLNQPFLLLITFISRPTVLLLKLLL
jgi:hypothetical protein